jgi:hypothetical protein
MKMYWDYARKIWTPLERGRNRDSAVGMAMVWTTEGSEFESRQDNEFSLHIVQDGSGIHPAF